MGKGRLEAFTDGVMAIIITIMVLELKVPHGGQIKDLAELAPKILSYALSFIYVGIYWNNHHHLFQVVHKIGGGVLWANLHLMFWLSLTPFTTGWVGESHFAQDTVAVYGAVLLMSGVGYYILTRALLAHHAPESHLARALGCDFKGKLSIAIYAVAIGLTFVNAWIGMALYFLVAILWLVPDRRIERILASAPETKQTH